MLKVVMNAIQFDNLQAQLDASILAHVKAYLPFSNVTLQTDNNGSVEIWITDKFESNITDVNYVVLDPLFQVSGTEKDWNVPTLTVAELIDNIRSEVTASLLDRTNEKTAHELFDNALGVNDEIDYVEDI